MRRSSLWSYRPRAVAGCEQHRGTTELASQSCLHRSSWSAMTALTTCRGGRFGRRHFQNDAGRGVRAYAPIPPQSALQLGILLVHGEPDGLRDRTLPIPHDDLVAMPHFAQIPRQAGPELGNVRAAYRTLQSMPARSLLRLVKSSIEVLTRFHPFVQDANDFDDTRLDSAIVDDVHGLLHGATPVIPTDMSQVEAAYTRKEVFPIPGQRALWIRCYLSQGGHKYRGVSTPALIAPSLGARREDPLKIGLRRSGEPKSRHRRQRRLRLDPVGRRRLT